MKRNSDAEFLKKRLQGVVDRYFDVLESQQDTLRYVLSRQTEDEDELRQKTERLHEALTMAEEASARALKAI